MKTTNLWNKKEVDTLKDNYYSTDKEELLKLLDGRTWSSVYNKAHILGLKRNQKKCDLSILLNETVESYYWIGFLLADGYFGDGVLQVKLSVKDLNHLRKFVKYIKWVGTIHKPSVHIGDKNVVGKLKKRFSVSNNKTYKPANITNIEDDDLLFSLIVGFIDGDGHISDGNNGRHALTIKCHKNWNGVLEFMYKKLTGRSKLSTVNNDLASIWVSDLPTLKLIKLRGMKLCLPMMKRKWDRIDLNKLGKREISEKNRLECFNLLQDNKSVEEITTKLNLSNSCVYKYKKEYGEING